MTDFPNRPVPAGTPTHISSESRFGGAWLLSVMAGNIGGVTSLTWASANKALYIPVNLPFAYMVRRVWWLNGSSVTSANTDFGIYTQGGAKIYSTGSTAQSGASSIQYVTPATPFVLEAGRYFFAIAMSSTTANRGGTGLGTAAVLRQYRLAGFLEEASALPLPTVATFAQCTIVTMPQCGITRTASGF